MRQEGGSAQPRETRVMPLEVDEVTYYSAADVVRDIGVSRQTLWRWRQDGKVPLGRRYRDRSILFTAAELEQIREYANRIEPVTPGAGKQLKLFRGR